MIQRIQTVYLILGALTLFGLLFFDELWTGAAAEAFGWFAPTVLILGGVAALVAIGAVFLYKNRERQRKVIVGVQLLTVVHMLALYGGLFLAGALRVRVAGELDLGMLVALLLPILAYIFFFLARRGVEKDIALVKSMDRLR